MKTILPPFLGLQFYWRDSSCQGLLNRVVIALLQRGAYFAGTVTAEAGAGVRDAKFDYPFGVRPTSLRVRNFDEYLTYVNDPDYRVYDVMMNRATGTTERAEIVTPLGISKKAALEDNHPIAIWTEVS